MEGVVAPLLHNRLPAALVDRVELPQLLTTVTTGLLAEVFGAATPEPGALVHPFSLRVTVYVPGTVTVMELLTEPLLHKIVPTPPIERVELPQLFVTVTTGVVGIANGAATADPAALVQPSTVCLTV
jgi:hypothetical protein